MAVVEELLAARPGGGGPLGREIVDGSGNAATEEVRVFFRLRVGPLSNVSEARQLCSALKKRRIGCLVVRPGT